MWSRNVNEIVSTHGYSLNQVGLSVNPIIIALLTTCSMHLDNRVEVPQHAEADHANRPLAAGAVPCDVARWPERCHRYRHAYTPPTPTPTHTLCTRPLFLRQAPETRPCASGISFPDPRPPSAAQAPRLSFLREPIFDRPVGLKAEERTYSLCIT